MKYNRTPNNIVEKFRQGKPAFGMQMYLPSTELYELVGANEFDFVMLDMEHTRINYETMVNLIRAADLYQMSVFVRVPANEPKYIRYALESGARGVVVPHIKNAEDVRKAKAALFFPPEGHAGVCPAVRAAGYYKGNWEEYMRDNNANTSLVVLFEDVEAVENCDEILAELKPGRDGFGMGLADLAHSLRQNTPIDEPLDWHPPYNQKAVETVIPKGKALGLFNMAMAWPESNKEGIKNVINNGANAIMFYPDQELLIRMFQAIKKDCEEFR
jgi:2-keto-3-deoxy-L-rhamnonate aldolase RhmA